MGMVMTRRCDNEPGQSNLVRRGAMSAGNGGKHLAGLQPAFVNGRVRGQKDIVGLAVGQDAVLGVGAVSDAIWHLVGEDRRSGQFASLLEELEVEVADAKVAHFSISNQLVQGAKSIREPSACAGPMDEI